MITGVIHNGGQLSGVVDGGQMLTGSATAAQEITGEVSGTGELTGDVSQAEELTGEVSSTVELEGELSAAYETKAPIYDGDYEVIPQVDGQLLNTKHKYMTDDVTILAIPYFEVGNTTGGNTVYIAEKIEVE